MEGKKIKSYHDLEIWQRGRKLVSVIYHLTASFPKSEVYGISSQLQRAAISIPLNIAEGWGRETSKSFLQFLRNSRGSLFELDTLLLIAYDLKYITDDQLKSINQEIAELGRMMNAFIKKINARITVQSDHPIPIANHQSLITLP